MTLRRVIGLLVCVEIASGVLQGFYTPIYTDIARHLGIHDADVNWFEAAQLVVSALVVPPLARLGDLLGHKRVLVLATLATAVGSWGVALAPGFATFLVAFAVQGAYVVWLPLEIAIVHRRTEGDPARTRKAAAVLVGALELSVIVAALLSGALVGAVPLSVALAVPAVVVTAGLVAIQLGISDLPAPDARAHRERSFDWAGLALLSGSVGLVMAGLIVIRVDGPTSLVPWALVAAGLVVLVPFWRVEVARPEPLVDVRLLTSRSQWPIQVTAALFGMSVLGAQIPLSTFVRTDPAVTGYGLGASASFVSDLIGVYVIFLAVGAFSLPALSRRLGHRRALAVAALLVSAGYAAWLPWHAHTWQAALNMAVAGLGSGALVAALPASAAAAAPAERTAFATGMTNATKTIGGAIASSVFAIALASTGSIADPVRGHASLSGYLTVWAICAVAALLAGACLVLTGRRGETPLPARERLGARSDAT